MATYTTLAAVSKMKLHLAVTEIQCSSCKCNCDQLNVLVSHVYYNDLNVNIQILQCVVAMREKSNSAMLCLLV